MIVGQNEIIHFCSFVLGNSIQIYKSRRKLYLIYEGNAITSEDADRYLEILDLNNDGKLDFEDLLFAVSLCKEQYEK